MSICRVFCFFFFFQAEDGIRDSSVTGVQTCALPIWGWWSMPRPHGDGFLIVGDSGGTLNSQRLKGIHLGMKSGMLAAETIVEALKAGGATPERLAAYQAKIDASWIKEELWPVRNFHQSFDHGLLGGFLQGGLGMVTGGRG